METPTRSDEAADSRRTRRMGQDESSRHMRGIGLLLDDGPPGSDGVLLSPEPVLLLTCMAFLAQTFTALMWH